MSPPTLRLPRFEQLLARLVGGNTNNVHGVVVGVVNCFGHIVYLDVAGHQSPTLEAPPIGINATFWAASCTKLLTAICALQAVERGQFTLDEPVSRLVPELVKPPIISFDSESVNDSDPEVILTPAETEISLRNLLTHTSGLVYEWDNPEMVAWRKDTEMSRNIPRSEFGGPVSAFYRLPLLFEPGQGWAYGGSTDAVGQLVERLSGETLGDYMRQHIFVPKDMNSTTFHLEEKPDMRPRLLKTARRNQAGELVPNDCPFKQPTEHESGGGGLFSSVPDFLKILADLISLEPTLLTRQTIDDAFFKPHLPAGTPALHDLITTQGVAEDRYNHSLGGLLVTADNDIVPAGTVGWGGLPNIRWFANKELGIAGIFATQMLPPGDAQTKELSDAFTKEVMEQAKQGRHLNSTAAPNRTNGVNGRNGVNGVIGINGIH